MQFDELIKPQKGLEKLSPLKTSEKRPFVSFIIKYQKREALK